MVKRKQRCDERTYVRCPVINPNVDPYKNTKRVMDLVNNGQPTDIDEFFDALEEDIKEFEKSTFGE